MREQQNVTFEPNIGPVFPVCGGSGTPGNMYGTAYDVPDYVGSHGHGSGSGRGYGTSGEQNWVYAAQSAIGQVDVRGGRGCARSMWPDRLGGVRFGACCPTEISFGRIVPEFTRAAMQAQEEENQKKMLNDARSAQQSEVEFGEFSEFGVVSTEKTHNPDLLPHLSADYGGYRDFGTFTPESLHGHGAGLGHGAGSGSGRWSGNGYGNGNGSGQFNGGRCSWR
jgi:hypothetical protein